MELVSYRTRSQACQGNHRNLLVDGKFSRLEAPNSVEVWEDDVPGSARHAPGVKFPKKDMA